MLLSWSNTEKHNTNLLITSKKNYGNRPGKWALSFRTNNLGINTNMHLESFHNNLKTFYFERKQNKQIDDLMEALLRMETDYYIELKGKRVYLGKIIPSKVNERHATSVNIPENFLSIPNENNVMIKSSTDRTKEYIITKIQN